MNKSVCQPSLKILSDYWTLQVIDELSREDLRFCEIERRLQPVNPVTLTKRLKTMQADGLIERSEHSRSDVRYNLTELGQQAVPMLVAVNNFSKSLLSTKETV